MRTLSTAAKRSITTFSFFATSFFAALSLALWAIPVASAAAPAIDPEVLQPASQVGVDAPELARLGAAGVGYRVLELVHAQQPDVLATDRTTGAVPLHDRPVTVDLWYPANTTPTMPRGFYEGLLSSEPPLPRAAFRVPALAVKDAVPALGAYPLVVVSHGFGNDTAAFSWLGENLASKGYVVAAIRHIDPDYSDRAQFAWVLLRRPLDTVFVARELQASLGKAGLVDPSRTALVGYSMGGYAVLTAGGATLDPAGQIVAQMPGQALTQYARGGAQRDWLRVPNLKAVVALAPAGGGAVPAWGNAGLADLTAPLFLISGNQDRTVNYETGAKTFFESAVNAPRFLLTYREGGHAIGMGPAAPPEMRSRLWDLDWFEDPVWRKDRILAINLHFITAFLDRYVKGDTSRDAYLRGLTPESDAGRWPGKPAVPYDAPSPGGEGISLWKGFQDRHAAGLQLEYREAR